MSASPLQMKNNEILKLLKAKANENGDNFRCKVRRRTKEMLPVSIATFNNVKYVHFASPERWVGVFGGGGEFHIEPIAAEDETDTAIAESIIYRDNAPMLPDDVVNADLTTKSDWEGPEIKWNVKGKLQAVKPPVVVTSAAAAQTATEARSLEANRASLELRERQLLLREAEIKAEAERTRLEGQITEMKRNSEALERKLQDERAEHKRSIDAINARIESVVNRPTPAPDTSMLELLKADREARAAAEAAAEVRRLEDKRYQEAREDRLRLEAREEAKERHEREERLERERVAREERLDKERREERARLETEKREADARYLTLVTAPPKALPQIEGITQIMEMTTTAMKNVGNMMQMATDLRNMNAGESDSDLVKVIGILAENGPGLVEKFAMFKRYMAPAAPQPSGIGGQGVVPQGQLPAGQQSSAQPPTPTPRPLPPDSVAITAALAAEDATAKTFDPAVGRIRDLVKKRTPAAQLLYAIGFEATESAKTGGKFHLFESEDDLFELIAPTLQTWFKDAGNAAYAFKLKTDLDAFAAEQAKKVASQVSKPAANGEQTPAPQASNGGAQSTPSQQMPTPENVNDAEDDEDGEEYEDDEDGAEEGAIENEVR